MLDADLQRTHLKQKKKANEKPAAVPAAASSPQLEAIAACESGGDPTAIGGGGLYRGKYQFTYETWQSVGGGGTPPQRPRPSRSARRGPARPVTAPALAVCGVRRGSIISPTTTPARLLRGAGGDPAARAGARAPKGTGFGSLLAEADAQDVAAAAPPGRRPGASVPATALALAPRSATTCTSDATCCRRCGAADGTVQAARPSASCAGQSTGCSGAGPLDRTTVPRPRSDASSSRCGTRIARWGKQHCRSIAWCESRTTRAPVGGGGVPPGHVPVLGQHVVSGGRHRDLAAAPRHEQTSRAWLLLSRHGSGHWPVCG